MPATRPFDSLEVVNSSDPMVWRRFRITKSVNLVSTENDRPNLAATVALSAGTLLSNETARESADENPDKKPSICILRG